MDWIWFLSGLTILLNVISIVILFQCKKLNNLDEFQVIDDAQDIQQSIEAFVTKVEKENEALYQKLVHHIKVKESALDERLRIVEEKLETNETSESVVEHPSDLKEDLKQFDSHQLSDKDQKEEKISQLYKQGFSAKQIAKVLQMDYGKVELIINMFKKRQSYPK